MLCKFFFFQLKIINEDVQNHDDDFLITGDLWIAAGILSKTLKL